MAARRPRTSIHAMSDEHRTKIGNSKILNNLIEHSVGERDMSSTQVTASLGLLKKVLPDLSAVEFDGTVEHDASDSVKALMAAVNGRNRSK